MKSYKIYEDQEYSRMIHVEGGSFLLGDEIECEIRDFWIGQYSVSQELWERVMGNNPSHFKGKNLPVESVNWYDAHEFCNALSIEKGLEPVYSIDKTRKDRNNSHELDDLKWIILINDKANGYRLLRESEWKYAARGGSHVQDTVYTGGSNVDKVASYEGNNNKETQEMGFKAPNELGIYDMSGNVWEWCEDWQGEYPTDPLKYSKGPESGQFRVLSGGSWHHLEASCRVFSRFGYSPRYGINYIGFRLSRMVW